MVHYHIAKNGGTTLRGILQARYGAQELHGPRKRPYAAYFHSVEERWRGRYFVVFVRSPVAKVLSQFYYARSELSGSFGRWHRCLDFGEYVASRRARNNHQFSQLMEGQVGCGTRSMSRHRHESGPVALETACPQGRAALEERVAQVLTQPRVFVGVVEHFDASLLALQRETGLPDVTYCPKRRHHNVRRVRDLPADVVRDAEQRNFLDDVVYNVSLRIFRAKACCYGITPDTINDFRRTNLAYQRAHCPPPVIDDKGLEKKEEEEPAAAAGKTSSQKNDSSAFSTTTTTTKRPGRTNRDRTLDNMTLGDPMWRAPGEDCDRIREQRIGMTFFPPPAE